MCLFLLFVDDIGLKRQIRHQEKCEDDQWNSYIAETILETDIVDAMQSKSSYDTQ